MSGGTEQTHDTRGGDRVWGKQLLLNTVHEWYHGGGEEGMEHRSPGDQPAQVSSLLGSSRAFLLADSHEKGVCQDPWRRRKITRHTHRKKRKKNLKANKNKIKALPAQEKRRTNSSAGPRSGQTGRHPGPHHRDRKFPSMSCCFAQGEIPPILRLQLTGL